MSDEFDEDCVHLIDDDICVLCERKFTELEKIVHLQQKINKINNIKENKVIATRGNATFADALQRVISEISSNLNLSCLEHYHFSVDFQTFVEPPDIKIYSFYNFLLAPKKEDKEND